MPNPQPRSLRHAPEPKHHAYTAVIETILPYRLGLLTRHAALSNPSLQVATRPKEPGGPSTLGSRSGLGIRQRVPEENPKAQGNNTKGTSRNRQKSPGSPLFYTLPTIRLPWNFVLVSR